jgi:hypothetical protein
VARSIAVLCLIGSVAVACGTPPGPSGTPTAHASTDPAPSAAGSTAPAMVDWDLENVGIRLSVPDGWVRVGEASTDELEGLPWRDELARQVLTDGWQHLRTRPGWDTGVIAGDPASGAALILRFIEAAHQDRTLDDLLEDVEATDSSDVSEVTFLGRDARQSFTIIQDVDGVERIRLGRVGTLGDGRAVSALFVGPAGRFDADAAIAVLDAAVETGTVPLGAPWDRAEVPELEALLEPVEGAQVLSGDLLSMVAYGAVQGNDLLSAATTIDRVLQDPSRVQAAVTGPASGEGATVTAIGWPRDPADLVGLRNALVDGLAYTEGSIGSCEALLAPASDDAVEAAFLRPDHQFWVYGTASEVDRVAATLLGC